MQNAISFDDLVWYVWIISNVNVVGSTHHVGTSLMANNEFGEAGKKQRSSAMLK